MEGVYSDVMVSVTANSRPAASPLIVMVMANLDSSHLSQTDPENTDYKVESGAYRTFQAETIAQKQAEQEQQEKEEEEANNPMLVRQYSLVMWMWWCSLCQHGNSQCIGGPSSLD